MPSSNTILAIEDNLVNQQILSKILSDEYHVLLADNGAEGLRILEEHRSEVAGIILDLTMPIMDGFTFLRIIADLDHYRDLPIIVSTASSGPEHEAKVLELGAWDFVAKPYNAQILKFRLHNAIQRSKLSAFQQLKYLAEYDTLTGIYNKTKFFSATHSMVISHPEENFVFIRFDIDRFQLVNAFYGNAEGDKLLRYLAFHLKKEAAKPSYATYGRMEADVFACCINYHDLNAVQRCVQKANSKVKRYNRAFDIVPIFGLYYIEDHSLPVDVMMDRATLAAKTCKGNYIDIMGTYDPEMSHKLELEQEIINEMRPALDKGQFCIYLQPKYSLATNTAYSAEALVRWIHPEKGILSPGIFIPIFEKNGFIAKLDHYMWEQVCQLLADWIAVGITPLPISVNVSRVNLYNPHLVDDICLLVDRYHIPASLLDLELTESAYTDNPQVMKQVIHRLHEKGFSIHMDDFGTGYSSLSMLKDIEVDMLKIDMQFLQTSDIPGRGENIIASIIRMAKWLNIPTVAEGVEEASQAEFLRSIGCEYVQGYFFAKPMPVAEYEQQIKQTVAITYPQKEPFHMDSLWDSNPQMKILFSNSTQATCIYEFDDGHIERLRANEAFYKLFGYPEMSVSHRPIDYVLPEFHTEVIATFYKSIDLQGFAECDYRKRVSDNLTLWINLKLKFITEVGTKQILFGSFFDITPQKNIEAELKKYKNAASKHYTATDKLLIIDDVEMNRTILRGIFENRFTVLEAENGHQALKLLEQTANKVDIILLDIMMPVMDGLHFLEYKKANEEIANIPIIMITSDHTPAQQIKTLSMGANDYIVKPFIPEIVIRRVENVLEANHRMREILEAYENAVEQAQADPLTQLYNRAAAERLIISTLAIQSGRLHALIMLDLDDFKKINDGYGHIYGDSILLEFSNTLKQFFRKGDIVARFGGDEFCIFLANIPSEEFVLNKCGQLCEQVHQMEIGSEHLHPSCSIGIAVTPPEPVSFETLYKNADSALYHSKALGKNISSLYTDENTL